MNVRCGSFSTEMGGSYMSASPPIATVGCQNLFGRKGPIADILGFDHVGRVIPTE